MSHCNQAGRVGGLGAGSSASVYAGAVAEVAELTGQAEPGLLHLIHQRAVRLRRDALRRPHNADCGDDLALPVEDGGADAADADFFLVVHRIAGFIQFGKGPDTRAILLRQCAEGSPAMKMIFLSALSAFSVCSILIGSTVLPVVAAVDDTSTFQAFLRQFEEGTGLHQR
jgi:hypothetical protein